MRLGKTRNSFLKKTGNDTKGFGVPLRAKALMRKKPSCQPSPSMRADERGRLNKDAR